MVTRWGLVALLCVAAACGGGGDDDAGSPGADASADASPTSARTTAVPPTTTTTVPPYSFDGSVPAPELLNTGTDFDAIARSLDAYGHWLLAHNPDPELIDEIAVPGSEAEASYQGDLTGLREHDLRLYDSASVIERVEVATSSADLVTLRVYYSDESAVVVRRDGSVQDEGPLPPTSTWIVTLAADATGRWRYVSSTVVDDEVEA